MVMRSRKSYCGHCTARGRTAQIIARTGAAADHPVATRCPETEYLKALWLRLD
jgi:23S rRNA G2069 N7-methylase RlmK/C1962 C5-methylase RlmI